MAQRLLLLGLLVVPMLGCGNSAHQTDEKTLEQKLSAPISGAAMNGKKMPAGANPHAPK